MCWYTIVRIRTTPDETRTSLALRKHDVHTVPTQGTHDVDMTHVAVCSLYSGVSSCTQRVFTGRHTPYIRSLVMSGCGEMINFKMHVICNMSGYCWKNGNCCTLQCSRPSSRVRRSSNHALTTPYPWGHLKSCIDTMMIMMMYVV